MKEFGQSICIVVYLSIVHFFWIDFAVLVFIVRSFLLIGLKEQVLVILELLVVYRIVFYNKTSESSPPQDNDKF